MRIISSKLTAIATCRTCTGEIVLEGTGDTIEEADKADHENKIQHELEQ